MNNPMTIRYVEYSAVTGEYCTLEHQCYTWIHEALDYIEGVNMFFADTGLKHKVYLIQRHD